MPGPDEAFQCLPCAMWGHSLTPRVLTACAYERSQDARPRRSVPMPPVCHVGPFAYPASFDSVCLRTQPRCQAPTKRSNASRVPCGAIRISTRVQVRTVKIRNEVSAVWVYQNPTHPLPKGLRWTYGQAILKEPRWHVSGLGTIPQDSGMRLRSARMPPNGKWDSMGYRGSNSAAWA